MVVGVARVALACLLMAVSSSIPVTAGPLTDAASEAAPYQDEAGSSVDDAQDTLRPSLGDAGPATDWLVDYGQGFVVAVDPADDAAWAAGIAEEAVADNEDALLGLQDYVVGYLLGDYVPGLVPAVVPQVVASAQGLAEAVAADPVGFASDLGPDLVTDLPTDVRTRRWEVVSEASVPSADLVDMGTITILRGETGDGVNCVHVLQGVPTLGPAPLHTSCFRDDGAPFPLGDGGILVHPEALGRFIDENNPASQFRLDVALEFTYDCQQFDRASASSGDRKVHLPFRPFVDGGYATANDLGALPAVLDLKVSDGASTVYHGRTVMPGAGHLVGYSLFVQQEQAGGSDLCA